MDPLFLSDEEKADKDQCRKADLQDLEELYPDSKLWTAVLFSVPICKCGEGILSLYKYEMGADFYGIGAAYGV